MPFGERGFLLLQACDERGEIFLGGGNRHRTTDKQRGGQRRRGPLGADARFHGSPFGLSWHFVIVISDGPNDKAETYFCIQTSFGKRHLTPRFRRAQ
jgi:hypothetical protein